MTSSKRMVMAAALFVGAVAVADARQDAVAIARALVIGQAYPSGNVYVAGFIDDEPRSWPARIAGTPLQEGRAERINAEFFRHVVQDSEEHYYFPQREGDPGSDDLFSTIDQAALEDRNLARYRAPVAANQAVAFLGWDQRVPLVDISYRASGQPRPTTEAEREEIAAARQGVPKNIECTTEPRFLDAAIIILTANVAKSQTSIRLSKYLNPGCAGHLSEIYVLDVIAPGQAASRFEFRHYHGVL